MPLLFKNFLSASRKRNLARFGLIPTSQDISWIDNAPSDPLTFATVAYSATPAFDAAAGQVLTITLTADVTSSSINFAGSSTIPTGTPLLVRILQDGTGGHAFTFPTNLLIDPQFTVDSRANYLTALPLIYNGSRWECSAPPGSFLVF